jgi:hypothetical protein
VEVSKSRSVIKSIPLGRSRPYDLPCVPIRKSDDLRNPCAKSRVLQVLLAQSLAMQIISTPRFRRRWKRERRRSGRCKRSPASDCSAPEPPLHLVPQPQEAILRVSPTSFREVWGACPGRVGALGNCRGGGSAGFFCGVLVSVCLPLPRLLWYRCLDSSAGCAPDSVWSHL